MIDNREVGRKIAAMRQANALTQQQLASMMNVSHQAVSKWESGQALPDIQTMLELTRFFGITIDQLIRTEEEIIEDANAEDTIEKSTETSESGKEKSKMSIQQLLQMAPYMSRETVEEIAMGIEDKLTAGQIARIAPYLRQENVEKLMKNHSPELNWESLRRIAPYLRREYVDELAKDVAKMRESGRPSGENLNRAINDIGKAFDDMGREMGHAVKKGLRFGKRMIREVSSAICDIGSDCETRFEKSEPVRSERAAELRKRAFVRAAEDGKWDWIAVHISELDDDPELRTKIAGKAKEEGRHDWICENMGGYADESTVEAAIASENWNWLKENTWQLDKVKQEKIVKAAVEAKNWIWLKECSDKLLLSDVGLETAQAALQTGEVELAVQLAENHLTPEQTSVLALDAHAADCTEALDMLICLCTDAAVEEILLDLAEKHKWDQVRRHLQNASAEAIEKLMECAVDQGDFDAVDMLDDYL